MRDQAALILLLAAVLAGCASPQPVSRPCGVIRDDLRTVNGRTPADQQRIDIHYERGRAAGCWG